MDVQEIDRLCKDFERRLRSDSRIRIEDFIIGHDQDVPDLLIVELIRIEKKIVGSRISSDSIESQDSLLCVFAGKLRDGLNPDICQYLEKVADPLERIALRIALLRITSFAVGSSQPEMTVTELGEREDLQDTISGKTGVSVTDLVDNKRHSGGEPQARAAFSLPLIPSRYRYIRDLGSGGFGKVLLAYDTVLHRNVALKLPKRVAFSSSDAASAFLLEARTSAQMHHPGLVTVHDVDTSQDVLCIVQEFIDGCDLRTWTKNGSASRQDLLHLLAKVADAVHFAHEAGFIHRDLKPSNILVGRDGQPHVADFGLAMPSTEAQTQAPEFAGTPAYMSPEQIQGTVIDRRSDIWSLGVILYELLTGVHPFIAKSRAELIYRITHDTPIRPSERDPRNPMMLDEICLRCLERSREKRFSSASVLARSLEAALNTNGPFPESTCQEDSESILEQQVLLHVNDAQFKSCKIGTIAAALDFKTQDQKKQLRMALQSLASRSLIHLGNDRIVRAIEPRHLVGKLTDLRDGRWSLEVAQPDAKDEFPGGVMIDFDQAGNAKQADQVRVCLLPKETNASSRGRVVEVIAESPPRFFGVIEVVDQEAWVISDDGDRLSVGPSCQIAAQHGESVQAERLVGARSVSAVVTEIVCKPQEQEDIHALMRGLSIQSCHPTDKRTADQTSFRIDQKAVHLDRLDLRSHPTYSIAELGQGDIANAYSITFLKNKGWLLGIHVTDVSSYFAANSDLDREAARRGASVLLGRAGIPMLPHVLSHYWLALKEGQERRCKTVWLEFAPDGELVNTDICRSIIRNQHLTYEDADKLLGTAFIDEAEGTVAFLSNAINLASLIRQKRHDRGEFELYRQALNVRLMPKPMASKKKSMRYVSSIFGNEFRLAANKAVAAFLVERDQPFLRRVQPPPGKNRLEQAYRIFRERGIACGNLRELKELQKLLESSAGGPNEHIVRQVIRRTIYFRKASYSAKLQGHFGLGVDDYCHFTDPLRRYVDITVQRAVDAALDDDPTSARLADLDRVATTCVEAENRAAKASRRFALRRRLREIKTWNLTEAFDAVIEQVTATALQVRGIDNHVGAVVLTETLGSLRFNRRNETLSSDAGEIVLQIGDIVSVRITDISLESEQVTAKLERPLSMKTRSVLERPKQRRDKTKKRESRHRRPKRGS